MAVQFVLDQMPAPVAVLLRCPTKTVAQMCVWVPDVDAAGDRGRRLALLPGLGAGLGAGLGGEPGLGTGPGIAPGRGGRAGLAAVFSSGPRAGRLRPVRSAAGAKGGAGGGAQPAASVSVRDLKADHEARCADCGRFGGMEVERLYDFPTPVLEHPDALEVLELLFGEEAQSCGRLAAVDFASAAQFAVLTLEEYAPIAEEVGPGIMPGALDTLVATHRVRVLAQLYELGLVGIGRDTDVVWG